jgi:lambda family phage portal protein
VIRLDLPAPTVRQAAKPAPSRRFYPAAEVSRLTEDLMAPLLSANRALEGGVRTIRARAQLLERSDPLVRKLRAILAKNVIGPNGFTLQVPFGTREQNQAIEWAWWEYANDKRVHAGQRFNLRQLLTMALIRRKLDGEVFLLRTLRSDSPHRIAWQLLEADQCPMALNRSATRTQPEIRHGVELDRFGAPTAFYFLDDHPSEGATQARRVPAEDVLHYANLERPGQVRGVPEIAATILLLAHLGGYREAELVAARQGANSPLLLRPDPEIWAPKEGDDAKDLANMAPSPSAPGEWTVLPVGLESVAHDLKHPNAGFSQFTKDIIRSVAASWDVSYPTLAADLEGANMSSARVGELQDRDGYLTMQEEVITDLLQPMLAAWADIALLTRKLPIRVSELPALLRVATWQGRRWKSVDERKEMQALDVEIKLGIQSRTNACAERGRDFTDILHQLKDEQELAKRLGVKLETTASPLQPPRPTTTEDPEDDEEDDTDDEPARRLRAIG